ncbi:hypothetical protein DSUL_20039 [Desulfovibrionales bacterium]
MFGDVSDDVGGFAFFGRLTQSIIMLVVLARSIALAAIFEFAYMLIACCELRAILLYWK